MPISLTSGGSITTAWVFNVTDTQSPLGQQPGQGLFAVDREGRTPLRRLIKPRDYYLFNTELPDLIGIGDDGMVLGIGRARGEDTSSLLQLEIKGAAVQAKPLLSLKGFDFTGEPDYDKDGKLLGVHYLSDAPDSHWYDPRMQSIQRQVNALLPTTNNRIGCGECADPTKVLVEATSDRVPAIFLLYDVAAGKLEVIARARPWIDPSTMASRDLHRFEARDGLEIPVYVTRPRGQKGPAPAVVLVHGGPWVRGGSWRWDADSQFPASRGYVVIEPEFRGSTGYGDKLFRAGFKQWGLAMQDDLVDATQWAARQGYADPKRVCIAGASYGGYAALMGLIRDADLYRCGVEWVGVSDIDLMYSINWSDFDDTWKRYGMPVLIGDRDKDAAQLAATSPLKRAGELKRPLLMAYGSGDRRVPLDHGTRFRDAVKANNSGLEFVVYPGEGHGWMLESTRVDFWGRVERFLAKHLAP